MKIIKHTVIMSGLFSISLSPYAIENEHIKMHQKPSSQSVRLSAFVQVPQGYYNNSYELLVRTSQGKVFSRVLHKNLNCRIKLDDAFNLKMTDLPLSIHCRIEGPNAMLKKKGLLI